MAESGGVTGIGQSGATATTPKHSVAVTLAGGLPFADFGYADVEIREGQATGERYGD